VSPQVQYNGTTYILMPTNLLRSNTISGGSIVVSQEVTRGKMNVALSNIIVVSGNIDWSGGNVTYVPLTGDIQTYVNAAVAGDTLSLASGKYTLTNTITIAKQLNIVGQGSAGFATVPVTPSHGTILFSTNASLVAFQINSDNVRLADLSINLSGQASTAINTSSNLHGLVSMGIDVIVLCKGLAQGFTIQGCDTILRNMTFDVESTNDAAYGVWLWNDEAVTNDCILQAYNVTVTTKGVGSSSYGFVAENINNAHTVTLTLQNSICRTLAGTGVDIGIASISTTTSNAIVNAETSKVEGADWDAYVTGTNQLNLSGSVVVNNKIFGTPTYRATMVSGIIKGNQYELPQLAYIPTNNIPINSTTASATNWFLMNIGGIPQFVATNFAAGGWLQKAMWP